MGIFQEVSQNRETLEEIVESGRLTRSQDRPLDAISRELALIRIIRHFKHHFTGKTSDSMVLIRDLAPRRLHEPTIQ
jgi:hypothetical protein